MIRFLIPLLLISTAALMGHQIWDYYMSTPWTRDAKVRAEIIQIAPKVSGEIVQIHVKDNDFVKQGTLLFEIESTDYINRVKEAETELAQAKSNLAQAKNNYDRDKELLANKLIPEKQVINEKLDMDAQSSAVDKAEVDLLIAKINLNRVNVTAPKDGYITNLQQRVGNYIDVGQTFVALVEADSYYILGYFNEAKVRHIKPGQTVTIQPYTSNEQIMGLIQSVGRAITDQSADQSGLIPNVQPTIPWVRLGQRVPVRVKVDARVIAEHRLIAGTTVSLKVEP